MDLKEIENQVLHLPENDRADLAQKILLSLDTPTVDEIEEDWLIEAQRRAKDLDEGIT
ncbi:MAG: addiction module protein [Leptospirales bacterium]